MVQAQERRAGRGEDHTTLICQDLQRTNRLAAFEKCWGHIETPKALAVCMVCMADLLL